MKVGIIGTGNIASQMAETINKMDNVELYAVASRTEEKAKDFADKHGFSKFYGSYKELASDADIELVYIATPHALHYEHTMLCLNRGKAVLCEKPFATCASQAKEMIDYAEGHGVFLCEAMWVRFQPLARLIPQLIARGAIGTPKLVIVNKGEINNIGTSDVDPILGGSALFGNGVYAITAASIAFGSNVTGFQSTPMILENGIDGANSLTLIYDKNRMAILSSSLIANEHNAWYVCGDKGMMEILGVSRLKVINIYNNKRELIAHYDAPSMISGYEYEVAACLKAITEGKLECEEMPHAETLRIVKLMDDIRKSWPVS